LTLIDTPGQEIFYRMRNSGSEVSDGSLLLIAVNDDVRLSSLFVMPRQPTVN
jgi:translation initiation factor IF-2